MRNIQTTRKHFIKNIYTTVVKLGQVIAKIILLENKLTLSNDALVINNTICASYPEEKVNSIMICVCLPCLLYGPVSRAHSGSDGKKCELVNPLLVGLQHHMDVGGPLQVLDRR